MADNERNIGKHPENTSLEQQLDLDVPSLETALQSTPEPRLDWQLGPGVIFRFGEDRSQSLELYSQMMRVGLPRGGIWLPRREPRTAPEGVVFEDPSFFLSVGPGGDVLFQYSPSPVVDAVPERSETPPTRLPAPSPEPVRTVEPPAASPPPAPEAKEKAKSEKFVGRIGEVKAHQTKQGKLVAEVEISVPDPDRPGSSRLVKFAAFGEKAEALQKNYQPGELVTAVGIPHELHRRSEGREWVEQQYYFVQLPSTRSARSSESS